ncbi:hypothetical protein RRG08_029282 [Elysia crispata]|uniref:Uncharacterized protein n=1 Tax=Elysia crispata TaxID=231223 RepID=A0AAE1DU10_9GAST|nr:hypothetical protein RRG08_029282 [Elysia crispata]
MQVTPKLSLCLLIVAVVLPATLCVSVQCVTCSYTFAGDGTTDYTCVDSVYNFTKTSSAVCDLGLCTVRTVYTMGFTRINSMYRGCGTSVIHGCDTADSVYPTCTFSCSSQNCNDLNATVTSTHRDISPHDKIHATSSQDITDRTLLRIRRLLRKGDDQRPFRDYNPELLLSDHLLTAIIDRLRKPLLFSLSGPPMSASVHRFDNFRSGPDRKGVASPYVGNIGAAFGYIKNMLRRWRSLKKIVYAAAILFLTIILYATTAGDGYEQDSNPDWTLPLVSREDVSC